MTHLTSEPSTPVWSMEDLMAMAFVMEKEFAERYAALAVRMRAAGREELATIFDRLVEEENSHMDMVLAWSQQTLRHRDSVVADDAAALLTSLVQGVTIRSALGARDFDLREEGLWLFDVQCRLLAAEGE